MPAPAAPHLYLKTHGAKVARLHMVDWIVLVLLAAIAVVLSIIEPFHRFVGKDMMDTLLYPLKDNTVPIWAVAVRLPAILSALDILSPCIDRILVDVDRPDARRYSRWSGRFSSSSEST
jgi:hypothetical protein